MYRKELLVDQFQGRSFSTSVILSFIVDRLITEEGMDGLRSLADYMDGNHSWMHNAHSAQEYRAALLEQFPQWKGVSDAHVTASNWRGWLRTQVDVFGPSLHVKPFKVEGRDAEQDPLTYLEVTLGQKLHLYRPRESAQPSHSQTLSI